MTQWLLETTGSSSAHEIVVKVTALVMVGWLLHLSLRRRNSRWRVLLWRAVCAGALALPLLVTSLPRFDVSLATAPTSSVEPAMVAPLPRDVRPDRAAAESLLPGALSVSPTFPDAAARAPEGARGPGLSSVSSVPGVKLSWLLGGVWIVVAGSLAVWAVRSWRATSGVVRRARPVREPLRAALGRVAKSLRCSRHVDLRRSEEVASPVLTGLRSPVILLPEHMTRVTSDELRGIFAHELAHVNSRDLLWDGVLQAFSVLLWFHPLAWFTRRAHRSACEEVSDAVAARHLGDSSLYSSTLARVALDVAGRRQLTPSLPMARTARIRARLERLRGKIPAPPRPRSIAATVVVSAAALMSLASLKFVRAEQDNPQNTRPRESANARAENAGGASLVDLPDDWTLSYDDGTRDDNSRAWPAGMGPNLCMLRARTLSPVRDKYDLEIRSLEGDRIGKIEVRRGRRGDSHLVLSPAKYRLRFERMWGTNADNFRVRSGDFLLDLSRPGMYELGFPPTPGSGEISGRLAGHYAINFERSGDGPWVRGFAYQNDGREYLLDGLPEGTYRLNAVRQTSDSVVAAVIGEVTIANDESATWNVEATEPGTASLRGKILGKLSSAPTGLPDPKWTVLVRREGSGPVRIPYVYEAKTIDALYVLRSNAVKQEVNDRATYAITGLAAGAYTVTIIENPRWGGATVIAQQSSKLRLEKGEARELDFDFRNVERRVRETYAPELRERERRAARRAEPRTRGVERTRRRAARRAKCSGFVLDAAGRPLPGTRLIAFEERFNMAGGLDLRPLARATTDASGKFLLEARVEGGRYGVVVAQKDGHAVGFARWTLYGHQRMTFKLVEPTDISGRVVDENGAAIAGAEVRVSLFNGESGDEMEWIPGIEPMPVLAARTDASGQFRIGGMPPKVEVALLVRAPRRQSLYVYGPKSKLTIFPGAQDIEIVLEPEARISGKITDKKTGDPIGGVTLAVVPQFSPYFFDRFLTVTREDGSFAIGGLRTGKYHLRGESMELEVEVESGRTTADVVLQRE